MNDEYWGRKVIVVEVLDDGVHHFMHKNGRPFTSKEMFRAEFVVQDLGDGTYKIIKNRKGESLNIITEEELFTEFL